MKGGEEKRVDGKKGVSGEVRDVWRVRVGVQQGGRWR